MNAKKESSWLDVVTTMRVARLHLEHLGGGTTAQENLSKERSFGSSYFEDGTPRVKIIASLVVFLLAVAALFTATKAQEIMVLTPYSA